MYPIDIEKFKWARAKMGRAVGDGFSEYCTKHKAIVEKVVINNIWMQTVNDKSCPHCAFTGTMSMSYTALANILYNMKDKDKIALDISLSIDQGGKKTFKVTMDLFFNYITEEITFTFK